MTTAAAIHCLDALLRDSRIEHPELSSRAGKESKKRVGRRIKTGSEQESGETPHRRTFGEPLPSGGLGGLQHKDWTQTSGWPGYTVYPHEIDEKLLPTRSAGLSRAMMMRETSNAPCDFRYDFQFK